MSGTNSKIALAFFDHLYAGRLDDALSLLAPQAVYTVLGRPEEFPLAGKYGKDQIAGLLGLIGPTVPAGANPTITSTIAEGDDVAVIGRVEAVAASGRDYATNFVFHVSLRDDLIVRVDEYIDTQHANDVLFPKSPQEPKAQLDARDEAEIRSVILGYVDVLDGRDFERIADAFTGTAQLETSFDSYIPGAEAFTGVIPVRGGAGIADVVGGRMRPLDATQHFLGAIWIEPTAEGARARTQIIAHHHRAGGFYHTGGTYIDSFVRTADGWRIERRDLHTSWTTGDPKVVAGD